MAQAIGCRTKARESGSIARRFAHPTATLYAERFVRSIKEVPDRVLRWKSGICVILPHYGLD